MDEQSGSGRQKYTPRRLFLPSLSFLETGSHVSQAGLTLAWLRHVLICRKAQLHFCAVPGIDPGFVRELYHGICMA